MHGENHELGFEKWSQENDKRALELTMDRDGDQDAFDAQGGADLCFFFTFSFSSFSSSPSLSLSSSSFVLRDRERGREWGMVEWVREWEGKLILVPIPFHSCWQVGPTWVGWGQLNPIFVLLNLWFDERSIDSIRTFYQYSNFEKLI